MLSGRTLSVAYGDSSPERGSPWQRGQLSSSPVNGRKKPAVKLQTFRPCQSLSLSGEVARRSRDGEGLLPGRTLSVSLRSTAPPRGGALGRTGKFRPHSSTAGRSLPLSCKLYALAKASPFRERWHGEAVTERVAFGTNPLSRLRRQLPREGEPLAEPAGFVLIRHRQEDVSREAVSFSPLPKSLPFGRGGTAKP